MNPIRKIIQNEIVEPALLASRDAMLAEVVHYNPLSYSVDVMPLSRKIKDNHTGESISDHMIKGVSVMHSRAVKDEVPEPGDIVYIDFPGQDMSHPIILALMKKNLCDETNRTGGTISKTLASQAPPVWNRR